VRYFNNYIDANEYAKKFKKKGGYYRLIKLKGHVKRCDCGRYYRGNHTECARCEKIRFDTQR
jgi:hypothetical protein